MVFLVITTKILNLMINSKGCLIKLLGFNIIGFTLRALMTLKLCLNGKLLMIIKNITVWSIKTLYRYFLAIFLNFCLDVEISRMYCPLQTEVINYLLFYDVYFTAVFEKLQYLYYHLWLL